MTQCCPSGESGVTSEKIKEAVRERYASAIAQKEESCCSSSSCCDSSNSDLKLTNRPYYSPAELANLPDDAIENSFGCGNPLAFAGVSAGDFVLDIGSGAGIDVLIAAKIVGPTGKVIGLDFTPEMIQRATDNAKQAGATNVEFRFGDAEQMPLEDSSVDWVISNCVINLAPNKQKVFSEIFRVLKPGGRVSISDIVTGDLPDDIRNDMGLWTCCVAGAIREDDYLNTMIEAGLNETQVVARQYYDDASLRSFAEDNVPSIVDKDDVKEFLDRRKSAMRNLWSAKVTARKPL